MEADGISVLVQGITTQHNEECTNHCSVLARRHNGYANPAASPQQLATLQPVPKPARERSPAEPAVPAQEAMTQTPQTSSSRSLTPAARNQARSQNTEGVLSWLQQQSVVGREEVASTPAVATAPSTSSRIGSAPSLNTNVDAPVKIAVAPDHKSTPSINIPSTKPIDRARTPSSSTAKSAPAFKSAYTPKNDPSLPPHKRPYPSSISNNEDLDVAGDTAWPSISSTRPDKTVATHARAPLAATVAQTEQNQTEQGKCAGDVQTGEQAAPILADIASKTDAMAIVRPATAPPAQLIMKDSAAARSPSPLLKDSAVSIGKYYFNIASLKDSMIAWHASKYPSRAEHAGIVVEKPGPFEAPTLLCKARHEEAVLDCPLKISFAIMEDKQSYRITSVSQVRHEQYF